MSSGPILLFIQTPFHKVGETVFVDIQALNGLRLWADNFDAVTVMAPLVEGKGSALLQVTELQLFLDAHPRIRAVLLPRRGTKRFLTSDLWREKAQIKAEIAKAEFLVFGFSGYVGDWGTVACNVAAKMGRPYAVFKDRVSHRVAEVTQQYNKRSPLRRASDALKNSYMKATERKVVKGSELALLHGQDTFEFFNEFASDSHLVHDIHISKKDHISESDLNDRLAGRSADELRIAYAGRVHEMKGVRYWVQAISSLLEKGVNLKAQWYGSGELLEEEQDQVSQLGHSEKIKFRGLMDHRDMLDDLRRSDVFVFTHMTEESPRCLIEALALGLPIVGFDGAYPRDLVGDSQAGAFVARRDNEALSTLLSSLANDPEKLNAMSRDARRIAEPFNDEDVFRHRSEVIKAKLST